MPGCSTNRRTVRLQMSCCHLAVMKKFLSGRPAQFDWLVATYHISQGRKYRPDSLHHPGGGGGGDYRVITSQVPAWEKILNNILIFFTYFVPGVG